MGVPKLIIAAFVFALIFANAAFVQAQSVRPPANAVNQTNSETTNAPNTLGSDSQSDYWRNLRQGIQGSVSIPDKNAGVMVQSEGWEWMLMRTGPLITYGGYALGAMIGALLLFFLFRGRIRVESGMSGEKILRFGRLARYGHWLNAVAFVLLALTGLNMLFGKTVLLPLIGLEGFSTITAIGKFIHNWGAFAFILGIVWIFLAFVGKNFLSKDDFGWIIRAGGLLVKGVHPPARFFNFGEKVVFWSAIIGGIGVIVTGLALLFPFQLDFLPGELPVHKMQFASLWHSIIGLFLIVVIIGHAYIGTIGIEGSFDSMNSGYVDRNWAKEHHSLWLEELDSKAAKSTSSAEPAE